MALQYIEHTQNGTRLGAKSPVTFEFDWTPPATNVGSVMIYVAANAANGDNSERGDHTYMARYTLTPPGQSLPPVIASGGIVNGASFQADVSAGSWISIPGTNLAGNTRAWSSSDFAGAALPVQLDGVGVKINGKPAYVAYISPTQINAQTPADGALGPVGREVTNNGVTSSVATRQDFSAIGTTAPARPGEAIILWGECDCTGGGDDRERGGHGAGCGAGSGDAWRWR